MDKLLDNKSVGVVRRIDNLGRIVIPMEIRRSLKIAEGDSLEINTIGERIVLKKYSALEGISHSAKTNFMIIGNALNMNIFLMDMDKILYFDEKNKIKDVNSYDNKIKEIFKTRKVTVFEGESVLGVDKYFDTKNLNQIIIPIENLGDVVGGVVAYSSDEIKDTNKKVLEIYSEIFEKLI